MRNNPKGSKLQNLKSFKFFLYSWNRGWSLEQILWAKNFIFFKCWFFSIRNNKFIWRNSSKNLFYTYNEIKNGNSKTTRGKKKLCFTKTSLFRIQLKNYYDKSLISQFENLSCVWIS